MSANNKIIFDESVLALLGKVSKKEGISNPTYEISKLTKKGDGYMGTIDAVKIKKNEKEVLSVITKTSSKNLKFRQQSNLAMMYNNEILFYDEIFPSFDEFQIGTGINEPFKAVAKCYATSLKELHEGLVLENLRDKGYRLWNRMVPMDEDHIALTVKEYARYHALNFAFKDQRPEKFQEFRGKVKDYLEQYTTKKNTEVYEGMVKKIIDYLDPVSEKEHLNKFTNYLKTLVAQNEKFLSKTMDKYSVIGHGDCWCNNIMYKYEDHTNLKKPTGICFLDFQIIRYISPILDFTHFFYTSSPKRVMDNYKYYLEFYYKNLCDFMVQLGSDPEKMYPRSVFDAHWKKYCMNGLNVAMFMIKVMSSESSEAPDFASAADGAESMLKKMDYEPKNSDYKIRVKNVIVHFSENNLI